MRNVRAIKAALGITVLAGCAIGTTAATAQARTEQSVAANVAPSASDDFASAVVATGLDKAGASDSAYTGTTIDDSDKTVTVWRTSQDPTTAYDAVPLQGWTLHFGHSLLTYSQTQQLMNVLWSAKSHLAASGITLNSVTTKGNGLVTAGVAAVTSSASQAIQQVTPAGEASTVSVAQQSPLLTAGRDNDKAPYIAGEHITGTTVGTTYYNCTSGFTGVSGGTRYLLTAYHCVNPSDEREFTNGYTIGRASINDTGADLVFIPTGSTTPAEWDGPYNSSSPKNVIAMTKPTVGQGGICDSGSYSGTRCGGTITNQGHFTVNNEYTGAAYDAYLYVASTSDGSEIVGQGDSGGPVIIPNGGGSVAATGSITGLGTQTGCVGRATVCSNTVYFSDVYTEAYVDRGINLTN